MKHRNDFPYQLERHDWNIATNLRWKYKVKVMDGAKGQGLVDPASYQFISDHASIPEIWPDIQGSLEHHVQSHEVKQSEQKFKFGNFKTTQHATHLLKLVDIICEWMTWMDPASIVEDTELTPFCPQTVRRTDEVKPIYPTTPPYPPPPQPLQLGWRWGV